MARTARCTLHECGTELLRVLYCCCFLQQIEMLRLLREQQAGPASECGGRVELPPEPTINLATPAAAACGRHQPSVNVVRPPDANHTADDAMATQDHEDYIEGHLLEVPNAVQTGLFKVGNRSGARSFPFSRGFLPSLTPVGHYSSGNAVV